MEFIFLLLLAYTVWSLRNAMRLFRIGLVKISFLHVCAGGATCVLLAALMPLVGL